jgi:hypothetical protein
VFQLSNVLQLLHASSTKEGSSCSHLLCKVALATALHESLLRFPFWCSLLIHLQTSLFHAGCFLLFQFRLALLKKPESNKRMKMMLIKTINKLMAHTHIVHRLLVPLLFSQQPTLLNFEIRNKFGVSCIRFLGMAFKIPHFILQLCD